MNLKIAFMQILPGKDLNENLEAGKKACMEGSVGFNAGAFCVDQKTEGIRIYLHLLSAGHAVDLR